MIVTPVKTHVIKPQEDLNQILDSYLPKLEENSVVAVTSKIVSLSENRIIPITDTVDKRNMIHDEADYYLEDPEYFEKYHISLTRKGDNLIASSGVDESNGNGNYILWPTDPYKSAENIWSYLKRKHNLQNLGVLITDSHTTPLRWGVTGTALSWCGFEPLIDYVGKPDIFGRPFKFETTSVRDALSSAAVLVMGEGNEQIPLAVISDVPFIKFTNHPPTKAEIHRLYIDLKDDIYAPLLTKVDWKKGGQNT
jgi:dihydrofolate synthase / folylpolyglutamate synthase